MVQPDALGGDRAINFPSLTVTVAEMIEGLRRVAGNRHLGDIVVEADPRIEAIVATWPSEMDATRALALGLPADQSIDPIIRAYMEDFLEA